MELEEMKNIWRNMGETPKIKPLKSSELSRLEYKKNVQLFKSSEIVGLLIAYSIAGFILYNLKTLDFWYLQLSAFILVTYLLGMPMYTFYGTLKMNQIDIAQSNFKTVFVKFHQTKINLKRAEKISFIASPFLFVAATVLFTKILFNRNLFSLNIQFPIYILIGFTFLVATLFNVWAFNKRDKQFKSLHQLLEEN